MNIPAQPNTYRAGPDERGHFGLYGGRFVAETLMPLILDLEAAYEAAKADPAYQVELQHLGTHYIGRPSPLYYAERLTEHLREVAVATPCWPAPVSAITRVLPRRRVRSAWPRALLILWAPVWARSSRFR